MGMKGGNRDHASIIFVQKKFAQKVRRDCFFEQQLLRKIDFEKQLRKKL